LRIPKSRRIFAECQIDTRNAVLVTLAAFRGGNESFFLQGTKSGQCHLVPLFAFIAPTTEISKSVSFNLLNANPREVKLIGYFAIFKKAYPNGKIYHYKGCWKNRAERTGVSRNTFRRIISEFTERGWAEKHGKTIVLKGKEAISALYATNDTETRRYLKIDTSKDIVAQLRMALLQTKINQINYSKSKAEARDKKVRKKYYAFLRAAPTPISMNKLAEVFGGKKSNVANITKKLRKEKMLKVKKFKAKIVDFCTAAKWELRHHWWNFTESISSCFFHKGIIWTKRCKEYLPIKGSTDEQKVNNLLNTFQKVDRLNKLKYAQV